MILVTGGRNQGKRGFAQEQFSDPSQSQGIVWCDGGKADWETFMGAKWGWNVHLLIRRVMLGEEEVFPKHLYSIFPFPLQEKKGSWGQGELTGLAAFIRECLLKGNEERILVTDEIGCGIVPEDPFERIYREETGRICCQLAAEARQVWRVCCGLGQRIK